MRSAAIAAVLFLAGCVTTPERPEPKTAATYTNVSREAVTSALHMVMIDDGWRLTDSNAFYMQFDKHMQGGMGAAIASSMYGREPTNRITFSVVYSPARQATRLIAKTYIVGRAGTPYERQEPYSTPESLAYTRRVLKDVAVDLGA